MRTVRMDTKIRRTFKRHFLIILLQAFPKDFVPTSKPRFDVNRTYCVKTKLVVKDSSPKENTLECNLKTINGSSTLFLEKVNIALEIRLTYYYDGFF